MKFLRAIFIFTIILSVAGIIAFWSIMQSLYVRTPSDDSTVNIFEITRGEGVNQISDNLNKSGLVRNKFLFETYVWLLGREGDLRVGVYQIQSGINISTLVKMLTGFGTGIEVTVTIPEGYTVEQIGALVELQLGVSVAEWENASVGLEGYLFPDTYRFDAGSSAEEIVSRLRENFDRRLAQYEEEIGPIENLEELIILASIIEREVQTDEDMALVSDIFHKRLEIRMALQADSTVNYVTGGDSPSISLDDRDIDSPYNTYKYAGLPLKPISNPGIASIIAANNPQANDYWYFLTTPEGKVIYAETFEEHVRNKMQYLK
ncbi:MAG: endolytic transglycosylase MltG [Patescibacteria group bacterium]